MAILTISSHILINVLYSDPILNDAAQKYESKHAGLKQQEMEKADDEDTLLDHLLKITTGMYCYCLIFGCSFNYL